MRAVLEICRTYKMGVENGARRILNRMISHKNGLWQEAQPQLNSCMPELPPQQEQHSWYCKALYVVGSRTKTSSI